MLLALLTTVSLLATMSHAAVISRPQHELRALPLNISLNHTHNTYGNVYSALPIGAILNNCFVPGTVALTFDDGPWIYTREILDTLSAHNARATFFLNGVNKGSIEGYPDIVLRVFSEGHQLGSHSYNHISLPSLSRSAVIDQMKTLENTYMNLLGFYPTYMRFPFLQSSPESLSAMAELGYRVIGASVDTKDYENDEPGVSWRSFEKFKAELAAGGTIVLAHDTHQTTVQVLVDNMLREIESRGLKMVTVGECLGEGREFWYRNGR
ncbi:uncharacterized protein N7477_009386 [Penicillium maclennaniae]|uniref:uncharacterized protein n=1 Tax=Penicillium maclennaniae TaxID=1343394 RepID=UPI00254241CB|nr:uncharacterized protein N7477_009386 [Penicillium maclennaniae]KAJ5661770.1 hypothetical protein N7477_009386 [Penicillium maclennaniae]